MKPKSIKQLKASLDRVFSLFIRQVDAIDGYAKCITCGKIQRWQDMDAGHFLSRRYLATRWEETNTGVQCKSCNIFNQGKQYIFGLAIEKKYGKEAIERLMIKKNNIMKMDKFAYQALIYIYEKKLKEL